MLIKYRDKARMEPMEITSCNKNILDLTSDDFIFTITAALLYMC